MSRITFNSLNGEAYLSGAERGSLRYLTVAVGSGFVDNLNLKKVVGHLEGVGYAIEDLGGFSVLVGGLSGPTASWGDEKTDIFNVIANGAARFGSDQVALAAAIYGYCEAWGWFREQDWPWAQGIIRGGLESGVYRKGRGWEELLEFEPGSQVVMDYSVTESFLCGWTAGFHQEDTWEVFDRLSPKEQWTRCCAELREGVRIGPDVLREGYGSTFDFHDLLEGDHNECCGISY